LAAHPAVRFVTAITASANNLEMRSSTETFITPQQTAVWRALH
jgi:hypothetical protein